jgi:hypothetical protein
MYINASDSYMIKQLHIKAVKFSKRYNLKFSSWVHKIHSDKQEVLNGK